MSSHDPYPTRRCPDARKRVKLVHASFLEHAKNKPTLEQITAQVNAEFPEIAPADSDVPPESHSSAQGQGPADSSTPPAETPAQGAEAPAQGGDTAAPAPATPARPAVGDEENEPEPDIDLATVPDLMSPETLKAYEEIATRPRATAERNRLDGMRAEVGKEQKKSTRAIFLVAGLLSAGFAIAIATLIRQQFLEKLGLVQLKLGFIIPFLSFVIGLVLAVVFAKLIAYCVRSLAHATQTYRIASKAPRDIPYVDIVGHIYEVELIKTQTPTEEQQQFLTKKLETKRKDLLNGKTLDEAKEELRISQGIFAVIAVFFAVANFLAIPHRSFEQTLLGVLAAIVPVAFIWMFMRALSNHTIEWPKLSEELTDPSVASGKLTEHRNRIEKAKADAREQRRLEKVRKQELEEALRRAETEEARKIAEAAHRQAEDQARVDVETKKGVQLKSRNQLIANRFQEATKKWEADWESKLAELKDASADFESQRGYSRREQDVLKSRARQLRPIFWWLLMPASLFLGVLATYPASLTFWSIFNLRYTYLFNFKLAPITWAFWVFLIVMAEVVMVMGLHRYKMAAEHKRTLENFYDEEERLDGKRYHVRGWNEVKEEQAVGKRNMILGGVLLALEFFANVVYLNQNSDANFALAIILALGPFFVFVALTVPHVQLHHRLHALSRALDWAVSLPPHPEWEDDRNDDADSRKKRKGYEDDTGYGEPA
jgi:hypothetical protein